jgi:hypothetical protein
MLIVKRKGPCAILLCALFKVSPFSFSFFDVFAISLWLFIYIIHFSFSPSFLKSFLKQLGIGIDITIDSKKNSNLPLPHKAQHKMHVQPTTKIEI